MEGDKQQKKYTDEERLKLAQKLDAELDEFISNLPKKKYEDGWPEDRWEEEMDKHPFFMKQAPDPGSDVHPLIEGLQQLKYDPNENEPEELAIAYKDDGNFNFKYKKYRLAILAYTEGIKVKCGNPDIEATLYNNRAAAHYFLKNYRSALLDSELALKSKPKYDKALKRAANCCYNLKKFDKAIDYCNEFSTKNDDKEIFDLIKKCKTDKQVHERDLRKMKQTTTKRDKIIENLFNEISQRGVRLFEGNRDISKLEPQFPQLAQHRVHFDSKSNSLIWPVIFFYPEYKIMDFIQEFNENDLLIEHLELVFQTVPTWDVTKVYNLNNLNVYYENNRQKLVKVDVKKSLNELLTSEGFVVKGGTPTFIVFPANSRVEINYLKKVNS